jgi:hypothetical protein
MMKNGIQRQLHVDRRLGATPPTNILKFNFNAVYAQPQNKLLLLALFWVRV